MKSQIESTIYEICETGFAIFVCSCPALGIARDAFVDQAGSIGGCAGSNGTYKRIFQVLPPFLQLFQMYIASA
jgi:hypothetical protein